MALVARFTPRLQLAQRLPPLLVERPRGGSSSVGDATALLDEVVLCRLGGAELGQEGASGVGLDGLRRSTPLINDVVVLADVLKQPFPLQGLLLPPDHVVVRLLLLESAEERLVLEGYLDQLSPAQVSVQALFLTASLRREASELARRACWRGVEVPTALRPSLGREEPRAVVRGRRHLMLVHDVCHLFKENPVLTLNLCVAF